MIGFYNYTVYATYLSLLSSVFGVFSAMQSHLLTAVCCLLFSGLCDMFDGRIARLCKTRSQDAKRFGVQIDSLSDLLAFGLLPAVIAYAAGLTRAWAVVVLLFYVLAALIRLAYFNVLAAAHEEDSCGGKLGYLGLPVPVTALTLPLLFCFRDILGTLFLPILVILLGATGVAFIAPFHMKKPGLELTLAMLVFGIGVAVALLLFS